MGLPQEIVDLIMDMLYDNIRALKVCSLTCKAMFASTRHLIHQRLHLPMLENVLLPSQAMKLRSNRRRPPDDELRLLSHMAKRGLGGDAQHILSACAHTFQSLTIVPRETGTDQFSSLSLGMAEQLADFLAAGNRELQGLALTENTVLHQLALCLPSLDVPISAPIPLLRVLSTITSPLFCEFVFELPRFCRSDLPYWGDWGEIDRFFEERFATRGPFKLTIRTTNGHHDQGPLQKHAKEIFPLLESRGLIHFEAFHRFDGYWTSH